MSTSVHPRSAISRRGDPVTSHEAADLVTLSGRRDAQAQLVYEALRRWPGRTSAELAALADFDRYVVARRLPELRNGGWAVSMPPRRCTVTGRRALLWRVLDPHEQLALHIG